MWSCHKCGKPVYFAERRQSLGFDWHPWCLKCEECGKVLNPGNHAEHKSTPYCHVPCYSALFGPKLFGHGSTVESHHSFGHRSKSFIREQRDLERKIKDYNKYYEGKEGARMEVRCREVNGRLILDGVLRVCWGIENSIRLREYDDKRVITSKRELRDRKCISLGPSRFQKVSLAAKDAAADDGDSDPSDEENGEEQQVNQNSDKVPAVNGEVAPETKTNPPLKLNIEAAKETASKASKETASNGGALLARRGSSTSTYVKTNLRSERRYKTMPAKLQRHDKDDWDEVDELLSVERPNEEGYRSYHTVHREAPSTAPVTAKTRLSWHGSSGFRRPLEPAPPSHDIPADVGRKNTLERLFQAGQQVANGDVADHGTPAATTANEKAESPSRSDTMQQQQRQQQPQQEPVSLPPRLEPSTFHEDKIVRGQGPRALRRRHGKKMDRSRVRRRSSINGHWYDRDTSVFTPPRGSYMSACVTSLLPTAEVVKMLLAKYQVESDAEEFALYVVKETGERRLVRPHEFPLRLRVELGPRDDINKLYLMDRRNTSEIRHEVAQYLKFSYAECRAFVNMFYEQEEREVDYIKYRYQRMKQIIRERMFDLRVRF